MPSFRSGFTNPRAVKGLRGQAGTMRPIDKAARRKKGKASRKARKANR